MATEHSEITLTKRNQSKVVRAVSLSSRTTTQPDKQPQKYMVFANAIFYNGTEPDRIFYNGEKVWEKTTTPPTPTYGSKTFAGKFIDDSMESDWEFWPNGATGASSTSIKQYVDPDTKEFNFEYDGTLTSCDYLLNGNLSIAKFQRIDHIPNTSEATRMYRMFGNNPNLEEVNVSDLDVSKVVSFSNMFEGCTALKSLDLSNWNFKDFSKKLKWDWSNFSHFCSGCTNLEWVKFPSNSMLYNYINGGGESTQMFPNCPNLKHIDNMKAHFNGNFQYLFYNCVNLSALNNIHWILTEIGNKGSVFYNCNNLTTVTGLIEGIDHNFDLHWCPLTAASAMVFINGLAEVSEAKTITFKSVTYDALTPEQIAVATSKGWNVVRS